MASLTLLRLFFLLLAAVLLAPPASGRRRHCISFQATRPSSLVWDPSAQHFLVGSGLRPVVTSVSDAGVLETLIDDGDLPEGAYLPAIALDNTHRRLLAVIAGGAVPHLAAYDLRLPRRRIFLSPLPSSSIPAAVAVVPSTGAAFVTTSGGNLIFRVDDLGNTSVFSSSPAYETDGNHGLAGIARSRQGYFLVASSNKKIFRVDEESGAAKEVLIGGKKKVAGGDGGAAHVAVRSDGSLMVVCGSRAQILESNDGWGEAAVYDEVRVGGGEGGRRSGGAAARERSLYVLMVAEEGGREGQRIEEVEWERENEGEWVVGMLMLGLGMAYFLYWRFQMGRVITGLNKKRA